jgi:hypothetical protein
MSTITVPSSPASTVSFGHRASALVELSIVLGVLELGMWEICGPFDAAFRAISLPLVAFIVWRSHRRRSRLQLAQLANADSLSRAWLKVGLVTVALAVCIPLLVFSLRMEGDGFRLFWLEKGTRGLFGYLAEKGAFIVVQQLLLNYFLGPCCDELLPQRHLARGLAALLFGLVHLPSLILTGITTVAGYCWLALFARGRRIAPLAVSHLALAVLAHAALPERWTLNMRVGAPAQQIVERYRVALAPGLAPSFHAICSDEYYESCGATSDDFIRGLYRDILGRSQPATADEVAAWRGKLAAHARTDVVIEFFNSAEFVAHFQQDRTSAAAKLSQRLQPATTATHNAWR